MEQPPDVSQLDTRQRLEVMRQYRLEREAQKVPDFSRGPPDLSGLEGAERLAVLRQYRQYLQAQDGAFGPNTAAYAAAAAASVPAGHRATKVDDIPTTPRGMPGTPRAVASQAPWLRDPAEPSESTVMAAAGANATM